MKPIENILCWVDVSSNEKTALRFAAALAERENSTLKLVDVIDDSPSWFGTLLKSHAGQLEMRMAEQLKSLGETVEGQEIEISTQVLHGRPAIAIVREVLRTGVDLVLKDVCGSSKQESLLLSSVEMRLLRNCPCPVWLNVPNSKKCGVVLAAIDPLAQHAQHKRLNQTIVDLAASVAEMNHAALHIAAGWQAHGESLLAGHTSPERLLEYVSDSHHSAEHGLTQVIGHIRPRIDGRRVHLSRGEPDDVILSIASEIGCDLLVMGSVARGIPGLLMGNTADAVLRQIECSVLSVKPDSFECPVKLS